MSGVLSDAAAAPDVKRKGVTHVVPPDVRTCEDNVRVLVELWHLHRVTGREEKTTPFQSEPP